MDFLHWLQINAWRIAVAMAFAHLVLLMMAVAKASVSARAGRLERLAMCNRALMRATVAELV